MATSVLQIINGYCSKYVNDDRLKDKAVSNPPLYAWTCYGYFYPAISLFTLPNEMPDYLLGTEQNPKFTPSQFVNTSYTTEQKETENFTIALGEEFSGYDLCSARIKTITNNNQVLYTPLQIEYNADDGSVNVILSNGDTIAKDSFIDIDFYKDGYFENDLSPQIMNILGKCFQVIWQEHFNTDWLSMVSKVEDKSFYEQNRATKMNADTARMRLLREELAGEMRKLEQNLQYRQTIPSSNRLKI